MPKAKKGKAVPKDHAQLIIAQLEQRLSVRHHFSDKDVLEVKSLLSDLKQAIDAPGQEPSQEQDDDNLETEEGK